MTLSEVKSQAKRSNIVDLGYIMYIGYTEKWKHAVINGHKSDMFVSNLGRLYDPKREQIVPLKPYGKYGYVPCGIRTDAGYIKRGIYRVVLETFKGPPPSDMDHPHADHIDNNRRDNSIYNLQWLSRTSNVKKEMENRNTSGEDNDNNKYSENDIIRVCELLKSNEYSVRKISDMTGINICTVYDLLYQRSWVHISKRYDFSKFNKYDDYRERSEVLNSLIKQGYSNDFIYKALNMEKTTQNRQIISKHRQRLNMNVYKPMNFSDETKNKIYDMVKAGMNAVDIAASLGINLDTKFRTYVCNVRYKINHMNK